LPGFVKIVAEKLLSVGSRLKKQIEKYKKVVANTKKVWYNSNQKLVVGRRRLILNAISLCG
jgi:hypothetical protein